MVLAFESCGLSLQFSSNASANLLVFVAKCLGVSWDPLWLAWVSLGRLWDSLGTPWDPSMDQILRHRIQMVSYTNEIVDK